MLLTILGWVWIVSGVIFLIKPEKLRNKLKKQSLKKIKKIFFALTLFLSLLLIKAVWGIPGLLAKIVLVFGIIGIFKAAFFLKAKAADSLITWLLDQPVKFFRMAAVGQIVFGAFLLTV